MQHGMNGSIKGMNLIQLVLQHERTIGNERQHQRIPSGVKRNQWDIQLMHYEMNDIIKGIHLIPLVLVKHKGLQLESWLIVIVFKVVFVKKALLLQGDAPIILSYLSSTAF